MSETSEPAGEKTAHVRVFAVGKHRLEALSDGVYAIALTLLVLELKLPDLGHHATDAMLRGALATLVPKVFAWLLSFAVIALIWIAQQRLYRVAERLDWGLARIELAMLALISLLPFSTALVGEYGNLATGAAIYAGHLTAIAVTGWLRVSRFVAHPELHVPGTDLATLRDMRARSRLFLGCTGATLALAPFVPGYNMFAMLLAFAVPLARRARAA